MDITYQYNKFRRNFGRQPLYCELGPLLCDNIAPNVAEQKLFILRNPVHQLTQNTPRYSERYINTFRAEYSSSGANHAEGGWPKDVNVADPEQTQRYRRKVEKEDNYIHCVMSTSTDMDHYILQNNAIDMYRTYYGEMESVPAPERIGCRTVNVYRDPARPPRPISSICWQPEGGQRMAVTYLDLDLFRNTRASTDSYIWDVENPTYPEVTITPPYPLVDLQFNQRDSNMLAGGLMSGQVGVWDRRAGKAPRSMCPPHVAHRDYARQVIFINAKSGQEFFSAGPDGCIKWWDVRNMSASTEEMIVDVVKYSFETQNMANASGVSALEFEPTIPTRFMVGTENGFVIGGNRKGKTALEKLPFKFLAHNGPIWSVERNPGFLKNFLTVGEWTVRVWSEDCRESSIMMSPPLRHRVTAATWSPTRISLMVVTSSDGVLALWDLLRRQHEPVLALWDLLRRQHEPVLTMQVWSRISLMVVTSSDGVLALWDLLRRQHEPVLTMQVCAEPLLRTRVHELGSLVALGSSRGNIYMAELSQSLAQSDKNDKVLLSSMLERESKRERILEARMREIRLKQRQAEEGGAGGASSPRASTSDADAAATAGDRDLADATATYLQTVRRELAAM